MYQLVCYGAGLRRRRTIVAAEPLGIGYLVGLKADFAALVLGSEGEHQLVGERPALAAAVAHVADSQPRLLHNLAHDVIATIPATAAKAMILSAFIIENYNSKLNKYKKWELKNQ